MSGYSNTTVNALVAVVVVLSLLLVALLLILWRAASGGERVPRGSIESAATDTWDSMTGSGQSITGGAMAEQLAAGGVVDLESPYTKVIKFLDKLGSSKMTSLASHRRLSKVARDARYLRGQLMAADNMNMPDLRARIGAIGMMSMDTPGATPYSEDILKFVLGTTTPAAGPGMVSSGLRCSDGAGRSMPAARKDLLREITKSSAYEQEHLRGAVDAPPRPLSGPASPSSSTDLMDGAGISRIVTASDLEGALREMSSAIEPRGGGMGAVQKVCRALPFVGERAVEELEKLGESFDTKMLLLDQATQGRPLVTASLFLLEYLGLVEKMQLDGEKLQAFLFAVEDGYYRENPYHNNIHAADVVLRLGTLLLKSAVYPGGLSELQMLAAVISAAIHDYEHPGTNNAYHIATQNPLARTYNDQHVLENHSLMSCLELMRKEELNFLSQEGCAVDQMELRTIIIDLVLSTDIASHWDILSMFQSKVKVDGGDLSKEASRPQQALVLKMALKCADLGHCALPLSQHVDWTARLEKEFFSQGDNEKREGLPVSPLMDRDKPGPACGKNQVGFFNFVVLPMYRAWVEVFPKGRQVLEGAHANYVYWRRDAARDASFTLRTPSFEVEVTDPVLDKLDKALREEREQQELQRAVRPPPFGPSACAAWDGPPPARGQQEEGAAGRRTSRRTGSAISLSVFRASSMLSLMPSMGTRSPSMTVGSGGDKTAVLGLSGGLLASGVGLHGEGRKTGKRHSDCGTSSMPGTPKPALHAGGAPEPATTPPPGARQQRDGARMADAAAGRPLRRNTAGSLGGLMGRGEDDAPAANGATRLAEGDGADERGGDGVDGELGVLADELHITVLSDSAGGLKTEP